MAHSKAKPSNTRRSFIKLCMGAVTIGRLRDSIAAGGSVHKYNRALLVDSANKPLSVLNLKQGKSFVFHYPFVTTPCFLLDLGEPIDSRVTLYTEDGDPYVWNGGVGKNRSIVAFSAICAHKMTHPAKTVSFINYRHGKISYRDKDHKQRTGSQLIYCCSERSVYDPRKGAQVLGGPANQPLTAVLLEYDAGRNRLYATGTLGGELYQRFFEKFTPRLQLEYLITDVERRVEESTVVVSLDNFSRTQMTC